MKVLMQLSVLYYWAILTHKLIRSLAYLILESFKPTLYTTKFICCIANTSFEFDSNSFFPHEINYTKTDSQGNTSSLGYYMYNNRTSEGS
jgi:hypothetical protein